MFAIETSKPTTAPAQAAVADGMCMSATSATMRPAAMRHATYGLEIELFGNGGDAPEVGSVGAMVM